ncbi:3-hydroxyacyl-CoA dehydrogenase family protein [Propionibacterium freudenreichii]|uniref:3-hydroxyacyl-CoA dehydrogenase family protein n=1 Tax=Propionibacterium freudenreichii TaxID=1744 RepID=UPI000542CE52|nr:3-hydroxyacyl-CoA dehydrogenase family protein [Propionibacterium freudenreichii]MDK9643911.1 3-hydroxyacyl-CoA dehydrogenase family protein [Propionibacterium freudenreichii]CEG87278.1 3-hydroxyacyl-CoA dehydrogenase [Propionibacterium freudenreichii]CEI28048.1 3-hydroxyacyl-CoA dehydrogenase [Propionibacterium freudenreichii]
MSKEINKVAVVGAGYMGGGIAQSLALGGYDVVIADADEARTAASLVRLLGEAQEFEDQGLYPKGATAEIKSRLTNGGTIENAVKDADFVEEAVFEQPDVKQEVLKRISAAAPADRVIGTNTSTIPVHVLEPAVSHPERFLTVHFSNPAPFIPGVELVASQQTSPEAIATVKEILVRCGREGAQVADTPGMVLNRLQYALLKEAFNVVEQGVATMEDVDTIVRTTFGFRLGFFGPFAIADQAGLDVYADSFKTFEKAYGDRLATPEMLVDEVKKGRLGVKNGKGLTGDFDDETKAELIAYRNKAYARMQDLLKDLGPAPRGKK